MLGDFFLVVTPWSCTWEGSRGRACVTRFSTSTWAMFRSVPISKVTVRLYWPSLVDWEDMYIMPSTPLTCCSIGAAPALATPGALAPGYVALTVTGGGVMLGYRSMGRKAPATPPISRM